MRKEHILDGQNPPPELFSGDGFCGMLRISYVLNKTRSDFNTMPKFNDLTGFVFDRLMVVSRAENGNKSRIQWNCSCQCGNKTIVRGDSLKNGHTRSCGCLMPETTAKTSAIIHRTHGASAGRSSKEWSEIPREYRVWASMKDRVKRSSKYKNVSICPEWLNSYEIFLSDMGKAPSNLHQIDRIDNSLGYSPENCRWLTPKENSRNRTNNKLIEWQGEAKCLAEWEDSLCQMLGLKTGALHARLAKGWSVEKAFATPNRINLVEWQGEFKCLTEWEDSLCQILKLKAGALRARFAKGWSVEKAFTTPNRINI